MKVYPLLETLAKVGDKDAMLGLVLSNTHHYIGEYDEFTEKMRTAAKLLEQSPSIEAFLDQAKRRDL